VPRVAGTGILVRTIARLHQQGLTPEEIAIFRYHLRLDQVYAGLAYSDRSPVAEPDRSSIPTTVRIDDDRRTRKFQCVGPTPFP
jgi:uncharacterized protein (DUF433 family)